ncbi:MAG: serine/threonine protein kinase, partial [Pseudomonadota bacterium]
MDFDTLVPLARGATGTVYRTTDPVTGETIAVKRLLHQDPASRARLQRELDALAALDHPGICRVIDS